MEDTKPKSRATSIHLSFPQRIYNLLKFCEENHQEHIASWMNDGTAFRVHDIEEFESELLPKYFNTRKYASFTRALCAHGFDCVRTGSHSGIYSHPKFHSDDPNAVSLMKRVKKAKTPNNHLSNRRHGSLFRDGDQPILCPSLSSDNTRPRTFDENAPGFGQLYQSFRSQIADRATYVLIRLPPGSHFVSSDESDDDSSDDPSAPPAVPSSGFYHMTSDHNRTTLDQQNQQEQIDQNFGSIFEEDDDDDFEPVPLSAHASSQNTLDHSEDEALLNAMEPRSIEEMKEKPDDLNTFYNILPVFPKPRYQALYDYSSQFSLPALFYFTDISSFGMCWAIFLIVGHTIQSLYTDFGAKTGILVLSPEISMLKHIFMDIMWTHSLLSAMILVPDYFGSSSVIVAFIFASGQPLSLVICLKTHYRMKSQKVVPFVHGEWWMADIVRLILSGDLIALSCIALGHYFTIANLKVIGVFLMNLSPLFACESYRLLLSIPTRLEAQNGAKKHK
ncbi:unnamed protein product [Cylindrotheca closterium]|uniref:HSF-type DNA-binding domain-containing protein n=1 Tax=Cylindrotheca closterium TaxID=2856 RepID=A0AAD2PWC3_9STRA|nr:unnamed protein product [Cylindrotheca closterium]